MKLNKNTICTYIRCCTPQELEVTVALLVQLVTGMSPGQFTVELNIQVQLPTISMFDPWGPVCQSQSTSHLSYSTGNDWPVFWLIPSRHTTPNGRDIIECLLVLYVASEVNIVSGSRFSAELSTVRAWLAPVWSISSSTPSSLPYRYVHHPTLHRKLTLFEGLL